MRVRRLGPWRVKAMTSTGARSTTRLAAALPGDPHNAVVPVDVGPVILFWTHLAGAYPERDRHWCGAQRNTSESLGKIMNLITDALPTGTVSILSK